MLSINDKLKLINEGHSISEINTHPDQFTSLITESSYNEVTAILESINCDFQYMTETSIIYLQESTFDTIKDRIKKFIIWIRDKILNIINWIKSKFTKKTEQVSAVAARVETKVKSGQLKKTIEAIKSGDEEAYAEVKEQHPPEPSPEAEPPVTHHIKLPSKEILKVKVRSKVIAGQIPDIGDMISKIDDIVNNALGSVEDFKASLIRGIPNAKITNSEVAIDLMVGLLTNNKASKIGEFESYMLGDITEYELDIKHAELASVTIAKIKGEGSVISTSYKKMQDLLSRWQDDTGKIIDKYKESGEVKPVTITNRVQQMFRIIAAAIHIINALLFIKSDGMGDCERILERFDSL